MHCRCQLNNHKSDPFFRGTDVIFTSQDVANPVSMLKKYLQLCNHLHSAKAALFLCEDRSHPSHSWFEWKFFSTLDHCFSGHSPQTGYTTFLASLGISESVIQAVGHWSSEAWKIYIWENPAIRVELQLASIRLQH